ncbi:MAG: CHRD domain-containing protein [Chloroflexi bacterium]|nr:MAG: CHRD domain-containing protein [Chloroflexota bacterium]
MQGFARFVTVSVFAAFAVVAIAIAGTTTGVADSHRTHFKTTLTGYQETPTVNTTGHGTFELTIADSDTAINFRLTYADLSGPPAAAHIHFGARKIAGGVSAFFCGGGGKPPCPATTSGVVTGTIVASDVIGPAGQGIAPGDLTSLIRAIRSGVTYANMHSAKFAGGEIRGQIDGKSSGTNEQD